MCVSVSVSESCVCVCECVSERVSCVNECVSACLRACVSACVRACVRACVCVCGGECLFVSACERVVCNPLGALHSQESDPLVVDRVSWTVADLVLKCVTRETLGPEQLSIRRTDGRMDGCMHACMHG